MEGQGQEAGPEGQGIVTSPGGKGMEAVPENGHNGGMQELAGVRQELVRCC